MTGDGSPRLARRRRLLERRWPWLLGSIAVAATLLVVLAGVDQGSFADYEALTPVLRGYTPLGVLFGLAAVGAAILSFAYALRKRGLQERWPLGRLTLAAWLFSHVYLGLLALLFALAHGGYGSVSFEPSSGKLVLLLLFGLVGSGVLWRLLYAVVPPNAAREVGNYSETSSRARAEACLVEIEKLAAGASPRFRELSAWVRTRTPAPAALDQAILSLPAEEQRAFQELATLSQSRLDALDRERRQLRYLRLLQGLRVAHVPLSLLFVVAVPMHVLLAYDVPARSVEPREALGTTLGGFQPASRCGSCHAEIYAAWRQSMHAHAMTSPLMIAQTNQVARAVLAREQSPDPAQACVACHGPIGTLVANANTLPLPADSLADRELLDDGVSCAVCHQWSGEGHPGAAGLSTFQAGLQPGRRVFGPFGDAVGNALHQSERSALFARPSELCQNCHSVELDRNGDGRIERGTDLVLQTLYEEWAEYAKGGGAACVDCHMPVVRRDGRAAESAALPFEQDHEAPPRVLRDHGFVGVDYPLDQHGVREATRAKRERLLQSAARIAVPPESVARKPDALGFTVTVENVGVGHNLPGGFAFVRQMWLEVVVRDAGGAVLAASGKLRSPADDLCDASIADDPTSPMRAFLSGCQRSDPALVNFQQMLVDRVQVQRDRAGAVLLGKRGENLLERPAGASESVLQRLEGGPVPRPRPTTGQLVTPLAPGETGSYPYALALPRGAAPKLLEIQLLFRVAAPYFLRALGQGQGPGDIVRVGDLAKELEVTEMARLAVPL